VTFASFLSESKRYKISSENEGSAVTMRPASEVLWFHSAKGMLGHRSPIHCI